MISLHDLKERKLIQWALAYLAGAWLVLQLADLLSDAYAWSPLFMQALPIVLVIGFFAALVIAWYHGEKGEQRAGTVELGMLTALLVIAGVSVAFLSGQADARATAAAVGQDPVTGPPAEQGSIAVLPFADMSAKGDQEYFTDGLTEELLNALAQLPELRVAARTSAFAFKEKDVGIDSIGRALNVAHVLEGSVRKADQRVRITAQLINAGTGYHLWSRTYDRELADIFAVQDEISRSIVEALQLELGGGRGDVPLVTEETSNPEAHTLVLRGEHARLRSSKEGLEQAECFFQEALQLDPEYARAHSGLADVYRYQSYMNLAPAGEANARAKREAERALALEPGLAPAHATLGRLAEASDWDWEAAEAHFSRAFELNPSDSRSYSWRAMLLVRLGRTAEAIEMGSRAVALDPVSPGAITNFGEVYRLAGQPERAIEQYRASQVLDPGHPIEFGNLAVTYPQIGRHAEAIEAGKGAVEAAPEFGYAHASLAYALARAGRAAEAERTLATLDGLPTTSHYDLATVYAGLGNAEQVFTLLDRAVEERNGRAPDIGVDPVFDPYRDDPRMGRLLERMGLPQ